MKPDFLINMVFGTIKVIGLIIFMMFFIYITNLIVSNLLIMRNTIIWFLGESGMIGFLTVQAIWGLIATLIFFFLWKIFKHT